MPPGTSPRRGWPTGGCPRTPGRPRSEEHTSELQSRQYLVCRLLLEKKRLTQPCRTPYYHNQLLHQQPGRHLRPRNNTRVYSSHSIISHAVVGLRVAISSLSSETPRS